MENEDVEECKNPQLLCIFWLDGVKYRLYGVKCRTCDEGAYYKDCVQLCKCANGGDWSQVGDSYPKKVANYKKCTPYKLDESKFYTVPPLP
ncbi:MAG: hypothetical protein HPY61_06095 [Methanotrichaceae archaeon]|nr:hypothetical protein [Methanotrichaceae archaeon]